jgi:hypothetical protein
MARIRRKTFVAREDLLIRISELAKERGYTLYDMVNEIFEFAIKAYSEDTTPFKALESLEELNAIRKAGYIPCMMRLWHEMADIAYREAKKEALKCWFEAGRWLAKLYETRGFHDPFGTLIKNLKQFTWEASEFDVKSGEREITVRILSPRLTESYATMMASFIEGVLEAFNYRITGRDIGSGQVRMKAIRKEGIGQR